LSTTEAPLRLAPRQRELRRIQRRLERFYGLEAAPSVTRFVREGERGSREVVLVRQSADGVELALVLPPEARSVARGGTLDDVWLQVAEGVSHFLYLAQRVRVDLPVTQLELELQAEVDKFVLSAEFSLDPGQLIARLFDSPQFLDPEGSEAGERYRLAHRLAARFLSRVLEETHAPERVRERLQSFYRAGQTEKISLASAA